MPRMKKEMILPVRNNNKSNGSSSSSSKSTKWAVGAVAVWIALWYTASLVTLFMNKYILSYLNADSSVLALTQMVSTAIYGAAKVYGPNVVGAKEIVRKSRDGRVCRKEFVIICVR